jgi:GxxExxY protein
MSADERRYKHQLLTKRIIGVFFEVYNELGFGFLEIVYREAMDLALRAVGLSVEKEFRLQAWFRGQVLGEFKADLVVSGAVILELKAVKALNSTHQAQMLNYLRSSVLEVGLLLNFGPEAEVRRLVFSNQRKLGTRGYQR